MSLLIENYDPEVRIAGGINTALPIVTTSTITASNVTSITTNLSLSGTLAVGGATTLSGTTLASDNITVASAKGIVGAGTGANGILITNPKNAAAGTLSGTALNVEINIGGTPYYFAVYPTKT